MGDEFDKIEVHQNVYLEIFTDKSDITVIPAILNVEVFAKLRLGP
jgi:hypothetical protein